MIGAFTFISFSTIRALSRGNSSFDCRIIALLSECRPIIGGAVPSEAVDSIELLERMALKASGELDRFTVRFPDIYNSPFLLDF